MKKLWVIMAGVALFLIAATGNVWAACDLCGDLDGDGAVNISDVVAFVDWYYNWPPITPPCPNAADVNCDGGIRVNCTYSPDPGYECDDLQYLLAFIFRGGPPPCDMDDDGNPECDPY